MIVLNGRHLERLFSELVARRRAASATPFGNADGVLARHKITPHSPWQHGVAERWVETVRRDLLDHVIVLNERQLQRLLSELVAYYHDDRTHLGLAKGTPAMRTAATKPIGKAEVVVLPQIGGLHDRYEWRTAA